MNINPSSFDEYIGQDRVKKNLQVILSAKRKNFNFNLPPVDHILLSGPSGLGKTSLAEIIAKSLHRPIIKVMASHVKNIESLSQLLHRVKEHWSFIFIDEIHALPLKVEEALYEVMDEFMWKGTRIPSFTLIGATTKEGKLTKPFRNRFTITEQLSPYSTDNLINIVKRSATILNITIDDKAVEAIALRSRGTARVANQLLKRISYYGSDITELIAQEALDNMRIDKYGLEMLDRTILTTIRDSFKNKPIGIDSLSEVVGEDIETVESREYYLVKVGFLQRTGRGRVLTTTGEEYVKSIV